MIIHYVIHSVSQQEFVLDYWGFVSQIWNEKFEITPVLFILGDEDKHFYKDKFGGLIKKIKKSEKIDISLQCKLWQLYGTKYFPETNCLISDINILPVSASYYCEQVKSYSDDTFIVYCCDAYVRKKSYPLCYTLAKGKIFSDVLNLPNSFDEFALKLNTLSEQKKERKIEELYLFESLQKWQGNKVLLERGWQKKVPNNRLNLSNWQYEEEDILNEKVYDFQIAKPLSKYYKKVKSLKNLILQSVDVVNKIEQQKSEAPVIKSPYSQKIISRQDYQKSQEFITIAKQLKQNNQLKEAVKYLKAAINLYPDSAAAYTNLGNIYQLQRNLNEAKSCYQKALEIKPNLALTHANLASIWHLQGDLVKAKKSLNLSLQYNPHCLQAYLNLANIYSQELNVAAVIRAYDKALQIQPEATYLWLKKNYALMQICDWSNYQQIVETIISEIKNPDTQQEDKIVSPFMINCFPISMKFHRQAAINYSTLISNSVKETKSLCQFTYPASKSEKIKVGYISGDFNDHPVGILLKDLFATHNRDKFEIYAYSLQSKEDEVTREIIAGCDQHAALDVKLEAATLSDRFIDLSTLSTQEAAKLINENGIHILIDLAGYTLFSRPEILALQPAPIQALFMGYPDTMGADFIQYIFADEWLITPEIAKHYTEEIVYLNHAFVASSMPISHTKKMKTDFGLPEDKFVFCCFNKFRKIEPQVFKIWMGILQQVPNSILWLQENDSLGIKNLRQEASKHNINPERLIFAPWLSQSEYLNRYQCVDLFLDTFVYNSGSTAINALYSGLPMLTCAGDTNASRMGASILASVNLEEMICHSPSEYQDKAIYFANHPKKLQAIRNELIKNRDTLPLFNIKNFATNLESKLEELWNKHCRMISIEKSNS